AGYKKDTHVFKSFREIYLDRIDRLPGREINRGQVGSLNYGPVIDASVTDFSPGVLQHTGGMLDLALQGRGFFTMETPYGLGYSRNGAFHLDDGGFLVSGEGDYVLGYGGRIQLDQSNYTIAADGTILVEGEPVERLLLADFPDWERLEKTGQGLFQAPEDLSPRPAEEVFVKQGYLEQANVDVVKEITDLITTMRIYEMNQKAIQAQDEILGKSVNEVGSIR
ncbi:MAG TPA: hypothetical protein GX711_06475, partial [Clostridia bacterium]|nr:hypothetical protein [Clostridia bacterium]